MKTKASILQAHAVGVLCALLVLFVAIYAGVPSTARALSETLASDPFEDAMTVDLADGSYTIDVTLEGGTGRASVGSPARLTARGGKATLEVVWSSPNYDYMIVAGKRYLPTNLEGNSTFEIPVLALDGPFDVVADTTAMSEPHEIAYQLTLDSASLHALDDPSPTTAAIFGTWPTRIAAIFAAALACVALFFLFRRRPSL